MQKQASLTNEILRNLVGLVGGDSGVRIEFSSAVTTASIDLNEHLVQFPNVSPTADREVVIMFAIHEALHCRYTREYSETIKKVCQELEDEGISALTLNRIPDFVNILEDVRIEHKGMREFTGIRNVLRKGYISLWTNPKGTWGDLQNMHLGQSPYLHAINRANYYWKMCQWNPGAETTDVQPQDIELVEQSKNAESAAEIGVIIRDFILEHRDSFKLIPKHTDKASDWTNEKFWGEVEEEFNEELEEETTKQDHNSRHDPVYNIVPFDRQWDMWGQYARENNLSHFQYDNDDEETFTDFVMKFRPSRFPGTDWVGMFRRDGDSFHKSIKGIKARSMVKEAQKFNQSLQRKKSAAEQARTQVWDTGELDPSLLHLASVSEDVFLRNQTEFTGSEYGIVFMLDSSGSMGGRKGRATLLRLGVLTAFCSISGIKFRVVMWGDKPSTLCTERSFSNPQQFAGFFYWMSKKSGGQYGYSNVFSQGTQGAALVSGACGAIGSLMKDGVREEDITCIPMTDGHISVFAAGAESILNHHDVGEVNIQGKDLSSWYTIESSLIPCVLNNGRTYNDQSVNGFVINLQFCSGLIKSQFPKVELVGITEGLDWDNFNSPHQKNVDVLSMNKLVSLEDGREPIYMSQVRIGNNNPLSHLVMVRNKDIFSPFKQNDKDDWTNIEYPKKRMHEMASTSIYTELLTNVISRKF